VASVWLVWKAITRAAPSPKSLRPIGATSRRNALRKLDGRTSHARYLKEVQCELVGFHAVSTAAAGLFGRFDRWRRAAGGSFVDDDLTQVLDAVFGECGHAILTHTVAKALFNKGSKFGQLGRSEEELAVYADVVARFGVAPELLLREVVATTLFNKGSRFGQLGRHEEAIAAFDDVVARFGAAPELSLREQQGGYARQA
jgi:hypothetical protein